MSLCNVPIFMEHFHKKVFKDTSCSSIDQQWVGDLQDMWGGVWKGGSVEVWKGEGELFRSLLWQSTVIFCCPGHFFVAVQCSDAVEVAHPTVILLLSALIVIEWKELDASSSPSIENFAVKIPFQSPPTSTWRKNSTDCEKTRASNTSLGSSLSYISGTLCSSSSSSSGTTTSTTTTSLGSSMTHLWGGLTDRTRSKHVWHIIGPSISSTVEK